MDTLPQFRFANDNQDDASILHHRALNTRRVKRYRSRRKEQLGHSESPNIGTNAVRPTNLNLSSEVALSGCSDTLLDSRSSGGSIAGDIYLECDDHGSPDDTHIGSTCQQLASDEPDPLDGEEQGTMSQMPKGL
jgi:hypothetical protein